MKQRILEGDGVGATYYTSEVTGNRVCLTCHTEYRADICAVCDLRLKLKHLLKRVSDLEASR